jgi:hypothetical protein
VTDDLIVQDFVLPYELVPPPAGGIVHFDFHLAQTTTLQAGVVASRAVMQRFVDTALATIASVPSRGAGETVSVPAPVLFKTEIFEWPASVGNEAVVTDELRLTVPCASGDTLEFAARASGTRWGIRFVVPAWPTGFAVILPLGTITIPEPVEIDLTL